MQNKIVFQSHGAFMIISGRAVVTYIHTTERKIVFPIAILFSCLKIGQGIFGAEYKNVRTIESAIQSVCSLNLK